MIKSMNFLTLSLKSSLKSVFYVSDSAEVGSFFVSFKLSEPHFAWFYWNLYQSYGIYCSFYVPELISFYTVIALGEVILQKHLQVTIKSKVLQ